MDPVTMAGLVQGGAALGGGVASYFGAKSQSSAMKEAMQQYLNYLNQQRETFLTQPESTAIRKKLGGYIEGNQGYDPTLLGGMKGEVYKDYGNSLADMTRLTGKAGAASTGVYTPGRADRTARLLGQNIASNRATQIRGINKENADVALSNQRFAVSAMPTYLPGAPSTPMAGPDVFSAGVMPGLGSYLGPGITQSGQSYANLSIYGPIIQKMMEQNQMGAGYLMNPNYGITDYGQPEMVRRVFPMR